MPNPEPEPVLLTARQVAARLGVSVKTLSNWRGAPGKGPEFVLLGKRGGRIRYPLQCVEAFEARLEPKP